MKQMRRKTSRGAWLAFVIAFAAFVYFAQHRVMNIGGCDSASYLAESFRLRGIDVGLDPDPQLPFREALVPLCMVEHHGTVRSFFPPGFPLLLAGAGAIGLEFFVTAFFGALGGLALFFLARKRAGDAIAIGTMILWYAAPLTFWGSTQIMSDFVAASLVLVATAAIDAGFALTAALILGFAIGVRPTCVLAVPAMAMALSTRPKKEWANAAVGIVLFALAWAAFVRLSFGSFELPYLANSQQLRGDTIGHQLGFLSAETFRQYAPVVVLAAVGLLRGTKRYVVWFAPFVVIHSLWHAPYGAWWEMRFLATALPALFLMAAAGARAIADFVARGRRWLRMVTAAAGAAVVVAYAIHWRTAWEVQVLLSDFDVRYARDTARVRELVPSNAVIGALEHTITLRFYGRLQTFMWCHPSSPSLVRAALASGRSVYVIFLAGDDNGCREQTAALRDSLRFVDVAVLPSEGRLVQVSERAVIESDPPSP